MASVKLQSTEAVRVRKPGPGKPEAELVRVHFRGTASGRLRRSLIDQKQSVDCLTLDDCFGVVSVG